MTTTITIDGTAFSIPLIIVDRQADKLYKDTTARTADGVLHSELIGVYFNYSMQVGRSSYDQDEYEAFLEKLNEPVESHAVVMPDGKSFDAYFSNVKDGLVRVQNGVNIYGNLTFSVIAISPALTP